MVEIVLEIIKFTLPAAIVAIIVYFMLRNQSRKEQQLKMLELKSKVSKEVMPLQLQAYERLALLMHRLSPEQLVPRLANPNKTVVLLRNDLINTIKQEVEHNITQQIYVSPPVWDAIKAYQMDLIGVVNNAVKEIDPNANSMELSTKIIQHYIDHPEVISASKVMEVIKADVKTYFR